MSTYLLATVLVSKDNKMNKTQFSRRVKMGERKNDNKARAKCVEEGGCLLST